MNRALVSLICLAVIISGTRYAVARETVRRADLQSEYAKISRQHFDGQLAAATVSWETLTERYGETLAFEDGSFEIRLDPDLNPDMDEMRGTLKHEACHVFVKTISPTAPDHGPEFHSCMNRFKQ